MVDYAFNITKVTPNGLIVNVTSNSLDIIPFLAPIVAAIIGGIITLVVYYFQRKQQRISAEYQKKQLQLTSMLEVFKILNSDRHRLAREAVYCAYHLSQGKNHNNIFESEPYHSSAAMVRADMDQMGLLIEEGLVDEGSFLKAYWNTVLLAWKALETNIEHERKIRKDYDTYMKYFSDLKAKALTYRDVNSLGKGEVDIYQTDDCHDKISKR